jgi:ABC-2 type transport system ATP-binding protein
VRPEKRLTLRFSAAVPREQLAELGSIVKYEGVECVLLVPQSAMNAAVAKALATLPVLDLNVENPPLEEVMSELFARSRAAREAA